MAASSYCARTLHPRETMKTVGKQKNSRWAGRRHRRRRTKACFVRASVCKPTGKTRALLRLSCEPWRELRTSSTYLFLAGPAPRLPPQCLSPLRAGTGARPFPSSTTPVLRPARCFRDRQTALLNSSGAHHQALGFLYQRLPTPQLSW